MTTTRDYYGMLHHLRDFCVFSVNAMFIWGGGSRFLTTHQHIIGYTVSFTLYDLHKMDSRQIKMTDDRLQKLSATQKKETTQNTAQQNYPVQWPSTTLGQETRWAYSTVPEPTRGAMFIQRDAGKCEGHVTPYSEGEIKVNNIRQTERERENENVRWTSCWKCRRHCHPVQLCRMSAQWTAVLGSPVPCRQEPGYASRPLGAEDVAQDHPLLPAADEDHPLADALA